MGLFFATIVVRNSALQRRQHHCHLLHQRLLRLFQPVRIAGRWSWLVRRFVRTAVQRWVERSLLLCLQSRLRRL